MYDKYIKYISSARTLFNIPRSLKLSERTREKKSWKIYGKTYVKKEIKIFITFSSNNSALIPPSPAIHTMTIIPVFISHNRIQDKLHLGRTTFEYRNRHSGFRGNANSWQRLTVNQGSLKAAIRANRGLLQLLPSFPRIKGDVRRAA